MSINRRSKSEIYWSQLTHRDWILPIAATEKGLCWVGATGEDMESFHQRLTSRFPSANIIQSDDQTRKYNTELLDYLDGRRTAFTFPCDMDGTPFQLAVWSALLDIPFGATVSYSDIANRIGKPSAVRAVGAAIGANPILIAVPCHRIVGKNGALTGYRGGLPMKSKLLELENAYRAVR